MWGKVLHLLGHSTPLGGSQGEGVRRAKREGGRGVGWRAWGGGKQRRYGPRVPSTTTSNDGELTHSRRAAARHEWTLAPFHRCGANGYPL